MCVIAVVSPLRRREASASRTPSVLTTISGTLLLLGFSFLSNMSGGSSNYAPVSVRSSTQYHPDDEDQPEVP